MWRRGFPARLMLLVGLVLGLVTGLLVGPAAASPSFPASYSGAHVTTPASAKAQPAPSDRASANLRHAPPVQPLAESLRAVGSSSLSADAAEGSDRPPYPSRTWAARSSGALRRVLDTVAPRLGRAPPPSE